MFTGIIEVLGKVTEITTQGTNRTFWIESPFTADLKVDQSVAHNGVCLTVEAIEGSRYQVTAVQETLDKTALGQWQEGTTVNLERSLLPSSRLDGHFVQGHVDTTGTCQSIIDKQGSWELTFRFPEQFAPLVIEKGSICINGISLTAFNVTNTTLAVAIIPFTWTHTNLQFLKEGDAINLEFDMIGKYILRSKSLFAQ
ncbi:riboflavin synthase alpha chain [Cnuella takakiae]|uniref:Riboflavin synthase n=1 Tax=Cnuella takakiae TaxID=1302690 RepID=A0A1M4ZZ57_9BACT|nr:riboflavin synthase [Cnuella takakiae]OLY92162.1 riboflavin synthase [Cnuella takakiae]SHF23012.1 riboflavin synthase alpha chain [Cnuella takakiae]